MRVFRLALAGLVLVLVLLGLAGAAPAPDSVLARLGPVTVNTTALAPGPGRTLTASVQVSTSGQASDQLDAATAGFEEDGERGQKARSHAERLQQLSFGALRGRVL